MNIPFKQGSEIKKYVSGINASLDIENVRSSIEQAAEDVIDVIGEDSAQMIVDHYESDNFEVEEQKNETMLKLDELTNLYRAAIANKGLFHHFIWLEINVSNTGVTTIKSDRETTAYKYQKQEAKDNLLEQFNKIVSRMIDFLNQKATSFVVWVANTDFKTTDTILFGENFYTPIADFTSGEAFDESNFEAKDKADVFLYQWSLSDQKKESESLIFDGYKDFDKYFDIDKSATFYVRARHIIAQCYARDIKSRFGDDIPDEYLDQVKASLAHRTIADAIIKLDFNILPKSIRGPINNEMNKKGGDIDFVRDKLRNRFIEDADSFLKGIDMTRESKKLDVDISAPLDKFNITQSEDKKYYSSI